jgi:predicted Zn-dependent protease
MKKQILSSMRLMLCLLVLLGEFCPLPAADPSTSAYFQALRFITQKKYGEAIKAYYQFIITSNSLLTIDCRKADLAKVKSELEKAMNNPRVDKNKSRLFISLLGRIFQQWPVANENLDRLRQQHPKSLLLTFFKGEYLLAQEEEQEAKKLFAVLDSAPKGKKFQKMAQELLLIRGQQAQQDPQERKQALLKIAFRHLDAFQRKQAEQFFSRIQNEFPDDPEAPRALLNLLMEDGRMEDAQKILKEWKSAEKPLLPPVALARFHYQQRIFGEVIRILTPILETDPKNDYAKSMLAESYYQVGEFGKGADLFLQMHKQSPLDQGFLSRSLSCLEESGRGEEAVQLVEGILQEKPAQDFLRAELAALYERQKDEYKAKEHFTILSKTPNAYQDWAKGKLLECMEAEQKRAQEIIGGETPMTTPVATFSSFSQEPAVSGGGPVGSGFGAPTQALPVKQQLNKQIDLMKRLASAYD